MSHDKSNWLHVTIERIVTKCFDSEGDTTVKSVTAHVTWNIETFRNSSYRLNAQSTEFRCAVSVS